MPTKQLLIYTCCDEYYDDYRLLWEYCAKKAYPEYDVQCDFLKSNTRHYAACFRLLNQPSSHEYVYITDVDMMIMREPETILQFHTREMRETGLCYSNTLRNSEREHLGDNRMTGLHFATKEWYIVTENVRYDYLHMLNSGTIGTDYSHDELMLKQICLKTVGLPSKKFPLVKRHHGIHFGTIRDKAKRSANDLFARLSLRVSKATAQKWLEMSEEEEFKKVIYDISFKNRTLKEELDVLYTFCRRMANSGTIAAR